MFNSSRFNFYIFTGLTIFFILWWIFIQFFPESTNSDISIYWSTGYSVILLLCGSFFAWLTIKEIKQKFLRFAIFICGAGVASQVIAQFFFSYNAYVSNKPVVYPANADIFYILGGLLYTFCVLMIAWKHKKERLIIFLFLIFLFSVLFSIFSIYLLNRYNFEWQFTLRSLVDLCYVVIEGVGAVFAVSILLTTYFFKYYEYRLTYIFICLGMITQYLSDMYFINAVRIDLWAFGSFGDLIFLFPYYFFAISFLFLLRKAIAVQMLTLILNGFLFIQLLLSYKSERFMSSLVTFVVSVTITFILLKKNANDVLTKETAIRLIALEESNKQLKALDKQKTEFLNIAAHQLRTPVSIIRNYVAMMQDGDFGEVPEQIKEVHNHIYQSNQWLVRLADEFLNLSKLESGQLKYHFESADLAKAVDEVVQEILPKAIQKGLILELIRPTEPVLANFDIEKIKHATMNLVENAVKYTLDGRITVEVRAFTAETALTATTAVSAVSADSAVAVVIVRDTGIGVPPDDLPNLFQKFHRGKNAHQIEVNTSTGLGLYIVRKFIEGHNGKVWAKSAGVGKGSTFGFWVPNHSTRV